MDHGQLRFECSAIDTQGCFRREHTGYGQDISPAFTIENLSPEAKTLAITLEDLSHPIKGFTHWVIWNLPATPQIPEGISAGAFAAALQPARQGLAYGWHRYAGPKPPKGSNHRYRFTVYALDDELDLPANVCKRRFLKKAAGHILQMGEAVGEYPGC